MPSISLYLTLLVSFLICFSDGRHLAHERLHHHRHTPSHEARDLSASTECLNPAQFQPSYFDYSVKTRDASPQDQVCSTNEVNVFARAEEDYSCGENKPCSNGACCAKTGYCGYGPASCGTNGVSPNDKCWSNCNAKAECGQYAKVPNTKCPLNVCCSEFGFCGTTKDFCGDKCQSNCRQPPSGGSKGDIQSRVIGYYEAWAHDRTCSGMTFQDIPIADLTHLHFSFGYVTPETFEIAPMDDLSMDLFTEMAKLKDDNTGLKVIVALGGWTFNDNNTATQPVFHDIVSSASARSTFITNLLDFLQEYGYDGVDFDWEYPGATDRGGYADDGVNFTKLLKELQEAIKATSYDYVVSFTAPTSYWYLRHFDLKNMMEYVSWMNVMSYDLHGVWDGTNPIGSHIYAHTNLTEIDQAMDLFWRNDVDPQKINLGMGFYGRSFQLANSDCWKPGCMFKGGASEGPCTKNSGTLSYKEIMQIVDQHNLTPYHDKEAAVKYVTWNKDQWVSYDDQETFQQKIEYANKLGLGGMLIWAVDQDTDDLQALQGLIYPKKLSIVNRTASKKSYWEDATHGECRVTECGGSCSPGEREVETQPCGGAKPVTRHSKEKDSKLCCPLDSSPDPAKCTWRGTASECNGHCQPGEVAMESNAWGDGKYCENGLKFYCCEVDQAKSIDCYWNDGLSCKNDDVDMTYDYEGFVFGRVFCCSPTEAKRWNNCAWHGKPGNCFDNHCDTITQVQLAESKSGEGETCGVHLERERVYCCDPAEGETLFLPVPLDYLFPDAPDEDTADAEYKLKVDPTWGGEVTASDDEPNDAAFGFFVLASPEEIQTSLDKRDGSHWELFDCFDDVTEGTHTIRMICSDTSEDSNCNKIYLGKGVPGTIIEMPSKCGPGKYAVANNMQVSANQTLPSHLNKRNFPEDAVVHDLTFNYDFTLVPRDFGDTQMRLDFSNEKGYWDSVVDKAGNSKRKRSLEDHQGNHKRWLEEEWRDDYHMGARESTDLHKRWFGEDVLDWLKGLLNVASSGGLEIQHTVDQTITAILINEQYGPCTFKGVDVQANLKAEASANVKVSTSFGLTIISTLTIPPDLSSSHLYFKNNGEVSATFTVDALTSATFNTHDIELFGLEQFPGAIFNVPGIMTVGPNFRLFGSVDASVEVAGHLQADVALGSWDIQQTYPAASKEFEPKGLSVPDIDGTQADLDDMTFDYSVTANGSLSIHLKPTFTFGIEFNPVWKVDACKVDLVADGYVTFSAGATTQSGSCPFSYGIEAGAELYAQVDAPKIYGWDLGTDHFSIQRTEPIPIVKGDSCPKEEKHKRNVLPLGADYFATGIEAHADGKTLAHPLGKRNQVIGPLLRLDSGLSCPGEDSNNGTYGCPLCGDDDSVASSDLTRRADDGPACAYEPVAAGLEACVGNFEGLSKRWLTGLDKRVKRSSKKLSWSYNGETTQESIGYYPACSADDLPSNIGRWYDYEDISDNGVCSAKVAKKKKDSGKNTVDGRKIQDFATEHIFEAQLLTRFLNFLAEPGQKGPERWGYKQAGYDWVSVVLVGRTVDPGYPLPAPMTARTDSQGRTLLEAMGSFVDNNNALVFTSSAINTPKLSWFGGNAPNAGGDGGENGVTTMRRVRNNGGVFAYLRMDGIWDKFTLAANTVEQALHEFDTNYQWRTAAWADDEEPLRHTDTNGGLDDGSLRSLWCFWIDAILGQIDAKARQWRIDAQANMRDKFKSSPVVLGRVNAFIANEFNGNGLLSAANMKIPTPQAGSTTRSQYAAWGGNNYPAPQKGAMQP